VPTGFPTAFPAAYPTPFPTAPVTAPVTGSSTSAFQSLDTDGDGKLNSAEFDGVAAKVSTAVSEALSSR
jgi:hypothetical protein